MNLLVMALAKSQKLPLYRQISELLQREIAAGHWQPGERLPVEAVLAKDLNVAVGTLRKALAQLEEEGLLERTQGSGTYVKRTQTGKAIYQFFHLELLQGSGLPSAEVLDIKHCSNRSAASKLQCQDPNQALWRIRRKRFIQQQLVATEQIWIAGDHAKDLTDLHESLYVHYREHFDFWISRVEDKVSCCASPAWVNKHLHRDMCGWVERLGWSNQGRIEEYSQTWFNPSLCHYVARWS